MNANEIYSGQEYAYVSYRSRGVFPMHAKKVEAISVRKHRDWSDKNAKSYVTVRDEDGRQYEVNARNIIDFWDEYEAERNRRREEARRAQESREKLYREERERRQKELALNEVLTEILANHGLTVLRVDAHSVTIMRVSVEEYFDTSIHPSYSKLREELYGSQSSIETGSRTTEVPSGQRTE